VLACLAEPSVKILLSWLAAAGAIGFAVMGIDKARAINGGWRVPEMTLFTESFLGGFWGVLLGAVVFHHKTSKPVFIVIAFLGLGVWAAVLWELGFLRCLSS